MKHLVLIVACIASACSSPAAEKPFFEFQTVFPQQGKTVCRIPSIVVTNSGAVLAFADRRVGSRADWGHDTDVVLRRSLDKGKTWQPLQVLASKKGICMHSGPALVDRQDSMNACIFEPAAGKLHWAMGGAPATDQPFVEFDLGAALEAGGGR